MGVKVGTLYGHVWKGSDFSAKTASPLVSPKQSKVLQEGFLVAKSIPESELKIPCDFSNESSSTCSINYDNPVNLSNQEEL